jgi:hypothetical protein
VRSQSGCVWKYVRTLRYNLHPIEFDSELSPPAPEAREWSGISARKCHGILNSPVRISAAMRRFPLLRRDALRA